MKRLILKPKAQIQREINYINHMREVRNYFRNEMQKPPVQMITEDEYIKKLRS